MFKEGKIDFAATDVVPTEQQLKAISDGVHLFPMTAGNVVVCYHLPEITGELKLSREALAGIFLGTITTWDDPRIAEKNKHIPQLPKTKITVVHRSGASGTTFAFTQHLSLISDAWKKGPGAGFTVSWPTGTRAMGNDGVAELVKDTPGAIGYLSTSAATSNKLPMAALENKAKEFILPSEESGKAGLAAAKEMTNLRDWMPDAEGKAAYPIVTFSWIVARKHYADPDTAAHLKEFLKYGLTQGQNDSAALGYLPLPQQIVDQVLPEVDKIGS
jgi:phosphate transport system substrate-binding protein